MNDFIPLATAVALMWKLVDFVKHCRVRDVNAIVTQLAVWGAGVVVTFLLASSDWGDKVPVGGHQLDKLNVASLVLFGLSLGATASVGYDFKRAFDGSDSSAMPSLVTGDVPVVPPPTVDSDTPGDAITNVSNVAVPDPVAPKAATRTSTRTRKRT